MSRRESANSLVDSPKIRALIWIYFLLLIAEGTLRKWLLPSLSDPLLLVRDPFLLLIYVLAIGRGVFPTNSYVVALTIIGVIAVAAGMTVGSHDPIVTAYGFDALFFHLPLIFVIPRVMNRGHILKLGRALLLLTLPMSVLMVIQFRSDPSAWINCGAGGGVGSQMAGALGKIRPPGFFTFITGAAQFLQLATAFLIFGLWRRGLYSHLLLMSAGMAVAISAVVSTSRLALGGIGTVLVMVGVVIAYDRKSITKLFGVLVPIGVVLVVATNLDIFHEGRQVFEARLKDAGDSGAGLAGTASNWTARVFGDFSGGLMAVPNAPVLGAGLGVGTNVGARKLSGMYGFLLAEGEWARVVLEIGPFLGVPYLIIRVMLCGMMFSRSARAARVGNALPMLLFGSSALLILCGQFSQVSTLGFAVMGAGMCLASVNAGRIDGKGSDSTYGKMEEVKSLKTGIAPYASKLRRGNSVEAD